MYVYQFVLEKRWAMRRSIENRKKFCSVACFSFYPNFEYCCPIERILKIRKIMGQLRMYHRGVEIII